MAHDKSSIRSRFVAALQNGKNTEEATALANGVCSPSRETGELPPPPAKIADAAKGGKRPEKIAKGEKAAKGGK